MTTAVPNMNEPQEENWQPCPKGAVQTLVTSLRRRRRRQQVQKVGGVVGMLAIVCVSAFLAIPRQTCDPELAGIRCSEVLALADDLIAGKLDDLTKGRIISHCKECEHCHRKILELRASLGVPAPSTDDGDAEDRAVERNAQAIKWQVALH
ncbi:hypothetical protein [Maioricimonas sp. JC845]|uniref:hypothetical protein n=1 Tax=Maioricimonas sp. JC845 TaxID=3232138 RepID=UPI00345A2467